MPKVPPTEFSSPLDLSIASKSLFLCFSHLRWDFVWQRPQHLLSRAARTYRVVFFEEPIFDADEPRLDLSERDVGLTVAVPHLPAMPDEKRVFAALRELVDAFVEENGDPAIVWYYSPIAMAFSGHLSARATVYDCMDELSAFKNAPPLLPAMEKKLFAKADLVFTGGMSLYEAKQGKHKSVHAFPSSIDAAHFASGRRDDRVDPADQAEIPHPRLGFFGVIDERMDLALVAETARLRPDWHFVMLGPVVKIDPADLPRLPNIHWLGGKSYGQLPAYIGGWDIGFMPFAMNEATRFISPTKTPEFLAAGIPVISTPITDVVRPYGENGLVEIAATAGDVVASAEELMQRPREAWLQRVDRHLGKTSWDRTWAGMHHLIRSAMAEKLITRERRGSALQTGAAAAAEGVNHV
jgi:glycosyltransferase involved in cell wall biosynthesis